MSTAGKLLLSLKCEGLLSSQLKSRTYLASSWLHKLTKLLPRLHMYPRFFKIQNMTKDLTRCVFLLLLVLQHNTNRQGVLLSRFAHPVGKNLVLKCAQMQILLDHKCLQHCNQFCNYFQDCLLYCHKKVLFFSFFYFRIGPCWSNNRNILVG